MDSGILITSDGVAAIKNIFSEMSDLNALNRVIYSRKMRGALFSENTDFDSFYSSLYAMQIGGVRYLESEEDNCLEHELKPILKLEILTDLSIARKSDSGEFRKSLIDEFLVADILNMRNSIADLIPLPTKLSAFETGCIFMRFNIYANINKKLEKAEAPGLSEEIINNSSQWKAIFENYKISEYQLSLI